MTICQTNFASFLDQQYFIYKIHNKEVLTSTKQYHLKELIESVNLFVSQSNSIKDISFPVVFILFSTDITLDKSVVSFALFLQNIAKTHFIVIGFISSLNEFVFMARNVEKYKKYRKVDGLIVCAHGTKKTIEFESEVISKKNWRSSLGYVVDSLPEDASIVFVSCNVGKKFAKKIAHAAHPRSVFAPIDFVKFGGVAIQKCCQTHKISMSTRDISSYQQVVMQYLNDGTSYLVDKNPVKFASLEDQQIRVYQKKTIDGDVEITFPCQTIKLVL